MHVVLVPLGIIIKQLADQNVVLVPLGIIIQQLANIVATHVDRDTFNLLQDNAAVTHVQAWAALLVLQTAGPALLQGVSLLAILDCFQMISVYTNLPQIVITHHKIKK